MIARVDPVPAMVAAEDALIRELLASLPEMTAIELRELVRREGLPITYLTQRRRDELRGMVEKQLRAALAS